MERKPKKKSSGKRKAVKVRLRKDGAYVTDNKWLPKKIAETPDPNVVTSIGTTPSASPQKKVADAVNLLNGILSKLPDNDAYRALEAMRYAGLALLSVLGGYASKREIDMIARMHAAIESTSETAKRAQIIAEIQTMATEEPWRTALNRDEQLLVQVYAIKSGVYLQAHEIADELPSKELQLAHAVLEKAESKGGRNHPFLRSDALRAFLKHFGFELPTKDSLSKAKARAREKAAK